MLAAFLATITLANLAITVPGITVARRVNTNRADAIFGSIALLQVYRKILAFGVMHGIYSTNSSPPPVVLEEQLHPARCWTERELAMSSL